MSFISQRKLKLVEKTKETPYSTKELQLLNELLEAHYKQSTEVKTEEICLSLPLMITQIIEDDGIWIEDHKMNLMQYMLYEYPEVFIFLTMVPLNKVPLYLWKPGIAPFAEWRTRINK